MTFMAAMEMANKFDDITCIEVHTGTHIAAHRQWVNSNLTIRGVFKKHESMPIIENARIMVCNRDGHRVRLENLVLDACEADYAVDAAGEGMQVSLRNCHIQGGWYGLSVRAGATATLSNCQVHDNKWNGIQGTGHETHLNMNEGTMVYDNGRCGVAIITGVQAVLDGCLIERNEEAGVEAFGKETRLQLDNNCIRNNAECGVKAGRSCMVYLVGNQISDADGIDRTCLVMKEGIRQVMPGRALPQVHRTSLSPDGSPTSPLKKKGGYFDISPSQRILLERAKRDDGNEKERALEAERRGEKPAKLKFSAPPGEY